jgi:hypothetical protein
MSRNINTLVSRHVTQWFHRVQRDEMSPALSLVDISTRILQYIQSRKLSLIVSEKEFRRNVCEFICTYYVAKKRDVPWRGPLSELPRPVGWSTEHEDQWLEWLRMHVLSSEFWNCFWDSTPESIWEYRVGGWRDAMEFVVQHYIVVQPDKIALECGDEYNSGSEEERME